MIVRCGRCGLGFDVAGPGRVTCPSCGVVNEVKATRPVVAAPPPMPLVPDSPSPRVSCPDCAFSFIVGAVDIAPCPNCGNTVTVAYESEGEA